MPMPKMAASISAMESSGSSAKKIAATDKTMMIARTITLVMPIVLPHTRVQILDYMYGINYGVSLCEEANAPE